MLNVPVATLAYPPYHLLDEDTKAIELIALLVGVVAQWSYFGWVLDRHGEIPSSSELLRRIAGIVGGLFGVSVLVATIPMHHVGLLYKLAGVVWFLLIIGHCLTLFRNSRSA